ncbi:hypothetical protein BN2476_670005 [Paraburkholderia piptadeniae]|uniref:Uncharacterized protein n=1 Tax=Paraburkholderia piptadeniae TaxID=1701573 RepID=A0A1N7SN99_9BURK|nr:hypothetical protein BN2476_670005 [Paraburkholderia piptadeniae]
MRIAHTAVAGGRAQTLEWLFHLDNGPSNVNVRASRRNWSPLSTAQFLLCPFAILRAARQ